MATSRWLCRPHWFFSVMGEQRRPFPSNGRHLEDTLGSPTDRKSSSDSLLLWVFFPEVGRAKDFSSHRRAVNTHRNTFWRKQFLSLPKSTTKPTFLLLDNFHHGAHFDLAPPHSKSFENLLLSVLQAGDLRIIIEHALDFDRQLGNDHGCRTKKEYEQRVLAVIRGIESMSPLLNLSINEDNPQPRVGLFEIWMQLTRNVGRPPVRVLLHSMASTSFFPNEEDVKGSIASIILHEAKRSPGEDIHEQAFRHFLSLAGASRQSRECLFLESVINRKVVITEKKVASVFRKIGFFFTAVELQEIVRYFRIIQENYMKSQRRVDDIPSLSMLTPTSEGLYQFSSINTVSFSSICECDGSLPKSQWRFICVLLDYDFQLVDFIHDQCQSSADEKVTFRQTRYLYGGFVDRADIALSELENRVYCMLFCLHYIGNGQSVSSQSKSECTEAPRVKVQLENGETFQMLSMFEISPGKACRWMTLAALYRDKKLHSWRFQAIGGHGQAHSIHGSIEEMNNTFIHYRILQIYEITVHYHAGAGCEEYEEYARRFSRNIQFGRNGRIIMKQEEQTGIFGGHVKGSNNSSSSLWITLRLQSMESEIEVYRHEEFHRSLPTVQSIYRTILRILADNGIKESLQQNPFITSQCRVKRHVEIRVVSEQSNRPVHKAHVFIEKNLDSLKMNASFARKIVPTLTMGTRLVSIRRRLQKKKIEEATTIVASNFVSEVIRIGTRIAMISLRRNSRFVPFVRARTLLKRAMRNRYEKIKRSIREHVEESERARIYSRSGPIRLQQLYKTPLSFTKSEQELLLDFTASGLNVLGDGTQDNGARGGFDPSALFEIWQKHVRGPNVADDGRKMSFVQEPAEEAPVQTEEVPESIEQKRERKKTFMTDEEGRVFCRLTPGSYSLYIFHVEYFEWTSMVVVFPSMNSGGSYGGTSSSSSAQEIIIPLETFKWSYAIQLVDFYQQQTLKLVANIPLQITDKCSSEQHFIETDATGSATWDVRKGIYSISASRACSCVLYSASKNIVVEPGRYRLSRSVNIPVLIGKVTTELILVSAIPDHVKDPQTTASVSFQTERRQATVRRLSAALNNKENDLGLSNEKIVLGSSSKLQLRSGKYKLSIVATGFVPSRTPIDVQWNNSLAANRHLFVLNPELHGDCVYRVVFSFVNATRTMDAIVEAFKDEALVGQVWRQRAKPHKDHLVLNGIFTVDQCEYQTFTITCRKGLGYRCLVACNERPRCTIASWRPRIQVYSSAGLIFDQMHDDEESWSSAFYWRACSWGKDGKLMTLEEDGDESPAADRPRFTML